MAKYNVNHSNTEKLLAKAGSVLLFNKPPIVIPRDKLEAAQLKVKIAQDRNKYLIAIILVMLGTTIWALIKHTL